MRGASFRVRASVALGFFLLEGAIGGSLASEASYNVAALAAHIALALLLVGFSGYTAAIATRPYPLAARLAAALTFVAALGATLSGTAFLLGGQSNSALYAMEGFFVVGVVALVFLIVLGADPKPSTPPAPSLA